METDYLHSQEKAQKILDSLQPLCKKHDKPFRRLSKAEQGWLLNTTMRYVRLDLNSSRLIGVDSAIIASLEEENDALKQENTKLNQQLEEMRHYA